MFPELYETDFIEKIKGQLDPHGPYIIDPETQLVELRQMGISWGSPWVFIKQDPGRKCFHYNNLWINAIGILPSRCIGCWKVVFRPQSVKDMMLLVPLMTKLAEKHNFFCKLGKEVREWTSGVYGKYGLWGCYFYNNSKEQGIFCWEKVKEALENDPNLAYLMEDKDADGLPERLVLKRGCTEFEIESFGDSKDWKQSDADRHWESVIQKNCALEDIGLAQPDFVKHHIMVEWFKHAHHAGDQTIKQLNDGMMCWRSTRYYHKDLFLSREKKRAAEKNIKNGGKK